MAPEAIRDRKYSSKSGTLHMTSLFPKFTFLFTRRVVVRRADVGGAEPRAGAVSCLASCRAAAISPEWPAPASASCTAIARNVR